MIFLIDLSPLYNYWLLSGSWGKLLVGALKGSLGGVTPLRPSIPDPFQDKNIFILHKSTTPSGGNTRSNNTRLGFPCPPPPKKKPTIMSMTQIKKLEKVKSFRPLFLGKCFRGKIVLSVGCWLPNFLPFLFLE